MPVNVPPRHFGARRNDGHYLSISGERAVSRTSGERDANQPRVRDQPERFLPNATKVKIAGRRHSELARHAGVAPSTATGHLNKLVASGLLVEQRQGRHRYVRLAGPQAAGLLEQLVAHVQPAPNRPKTLRTATASAALARGRTCYDHVAGRLGVAITDAMVGNGLLDQDTGFALTSAGVRWLTVDLGVASADLGGTRRPLARACLDWTERAVRQLLGIDPPRTID